MKEIINVVLYVSADKTKKACIFYSDGTTKECTYEEGKSAVLEVAKQKNITNVEQLREIRNKEFFYTLTEEDFKERYNSFLPQISVEYDPKKFDEAIKRLENFGKEEPTTEVIEEVVEEKEEVAEPTTEVIEIKEKITPTKSENIVLVPVTKSYDSEDEEEYDDDEEIIDDDVIEGEIVHQEEIESYIPSEQYDENLEDHEFDDTEIVYEETFKEKVVKQAKEHPKIATAIVIGAITVGVLASAWLLKKCNKTGVIKPINTKITEENTDDKKTQETVNDYTITDVDVTYNVNNNDLYNDYTFAELLNVTTNDFQKKSMINVSSGLTGFNSVFAKNYMESGHDIRAALTFDEVVALQQAYNNYTTDEVRAYFNGYEVDAVYMSNAYKAASLQLMGAYAIETSEHPVDMTILIDSQEGRDFYNKYHTMYLAAKEATGDEQIRLVKEFYAEVEKDFPITDEVRTDGISHADSHNSLKDYQLAVAPMIASAEMIFQNLDIDYTLNDSKIDFLNDIGLCNHADDKFERLETITLTAYEDNENPLYEQYRNAIIAELVKSNEYVIDDAHRELSELRRFQEVVNHDALWLHRTTYEGEYHESYFDDEYYSWEETETEYETVVTIDEAPIPDDEKKIIDNETAQENEDAKKKAEEEAEQERQRQQDEADEEAKKIQEEIEADEKQLEEDINDINKTIDENNKDTDTTNDKPVNENDYDNIDFDDEYTDDKGNLDNSVENITIDGSGVNEKLPDPNVTGASFDANSVQVGTSTPVVEYTDEEIVDAYVEYAGVEGAYIEYDVDYVPYDEDGNPIIVEETPKQLTR